MVWTQCPRLSPHCKDFCKIQDAWDTYVHQVCGVCSPAFWKFFLELHTLSRSAIDSALHAAKTCFDLDKSWKHFPSSLRTLQRKIDTVPEFWHHVTHSTIIDISSFRLPVKSVICRFIDPIWGWITSARRIDPRDMHWHPQPLQHPASGERMYGAGVQCGDAFAAAARSCPPNAYPMCVSLHWDGSTSKGMSSVPICIGVVNTNLLSTSTQFCLGYMPVVTGVGKNFFYTPKATELKFFIRNAVITVILQVLETGAKKGVICRLMNPNGIDTRRLLIPKLMCMNQLQVPDHQSRANLVGNPLGWASASTNAQMHQF